MSPNNKLSCQPQCSMTSKGTASSSGGDGCAYSLAVLRVGLGQCDGFKML